MTEEQIRPIAENYVEEFCHDINGEYTDGDLICAGIGTSMIVARKLEAKNKELQNQIDKMKSDVLSNIKWADFNKNEQMWQKLVKMYNQWNAE